jgi:isocitrate dehydrogenase
MKFVGEDGTDRARSVQVARRRRRHEHTTRRSDPGLCSGIADYGCRGYPVYLSTKNTISKVMTVASRTSSKRYTRDQEGFEAKRLTYEHCLIDDMVASALKWSGGLRLGLQELRRRRVVRTPRRAMARSA